MRWDKRTEGWLMNLWIMGKVSDAFPLDKMSMTEEATKTYLWTKIPV